MFQLTKRYLTNYLEAQLLITLISLPILVNWGIPISTATFIGNLLFIPFITIFLIISSLLFVTELLNIPNEYIALLLNHITNIFEVFLNLGKKEWLTCFTTNNNFLLVLIPIVTVLIIKQIREKELRIFYLSFFLIITTSYFYFNAPKLNEKNYIPFSKEKLLLENKHEQLSLIDLGHFNTKGSPESYINFDLKPYLIKNFGILSIDNLVLMKPSVRSFKAATELNNTLQIKKVFINMKNPKLSKYAWKCYFELRNNLSKQNTKIIKLDNLL
ncbi:hypothetical protein KAW80_01280 [Candidatus Babeliales bacterium]|nr:hypothetical protein [Candidatus Babeliales bacterium]